MRAAGIRESALDPVPGAQKGSASCSHRCRTDRSHDPGWRSYTAPATHTRGKHRFGSRYTVGHDDSFHAHPASVPCLPDSGSGRDRRRRRIALRKAPACAALVAWLAISRRSAPTQHINSLCDALAQHFTAMIVCIQQRCTGRCAERRRVLRQQALDLCHLTRWMYALSDNGPAGVHHQRWLVAWPPSTIFARLQHGFGIGLCDRSGGRLPSPRDALLGALIGRVCQLRRR
jgi:hypothetical protein